jgi:hypothetical protein
MELWNDLCALPERFREDSRAFHEYRLYRLGKFQQFLPVVRPHFYREGKDLKDKMDLSGLFGLAPFVYL